MGGAQEIGRRVALISMFVSAALSAIKITVGYMAGSTAVVADGVESAGDVLASAIVLFGLTVAARPADEKHPYGHGRFETLTGLGIGLLLALTGLGIAVHSLDRLHTELTAPAAFAIWPLIASIVIKSFMAAAKFRYGKRMHSAGLVADAWNDTVDILSGSVALAAVGLTLYDPARFLAADHYGGFLVGVIVIFLGLRVVWETATHLMDTMPDEEAMREIRAAARSVPGALGVEKCFARKTGLRYHVDLHLEVDPDLTVRDSHRIAGAVRDRIRQELDWVADVLVHVEPHDGEGERPSDDT
ncbi:MAG: cation diffusion facilitator family transporter [Bryobacteraceae bacterium]